MTGGGWHAVWIVSIEALSLATAHPLGRALHAWTPRARHVLDSFAAGVSIAFVAVDLLVELTGTARHHVHAVLPIGTEPEGSLFAVVLMGLALAFVAKALVVQRATWAEYRLQVLPNGLYRILAGAALVLEVEHGVGSAVLYGLPLLLHLAVAEQRLVDRFPAHHGGLRAAALALTPLVGAGSWALLDLPRAALYVPLALVAGATIVQVFLEDLPSAARIRVGSFLVGVVLYSVLIVVRWNG